MARIARVVVPCIPHHVTQRGNRSQRTFFSEDDYKSYLEVLWQWCARFGTAVWAYCLMPNHAHLVLVPSTLDGLRRAVGEAHRRYTVRINSREGWTGHLWQGRFCSYPMDNRHFLAAVRYVETNPVRAGIVSRAEDYPWSSARAHIQGHPVFGSDPLPQLVPDWRSFLLQCADDQEKKRMHYHEKTGRPMGDEAFVGMLERYLNRSLCPGMPGRRPAARSGERALQQPAGCVQGEPNHVGVVSLDS